MAYEVDYLADIGLPVLVRQVTVGEGSSFQEVAHQEQQFVANVKGALLDKELAFWIEQLQRVDVPDFKLSVCAILLLVFQ